jgi:hypothetical protein
MELGWQGAAAAATGERRKLAAAGLFVTWLGVTAWLFWQWQATGLGPPLADGAAGDQFAQFDATRLDASAVVRLQSVSGAASRTVVVHLRDPGCACSRVADEHFLALVARHQADSVIFAVAEAPGPRVTPARGMERLPHLTPAESELLWRNLPAAPAAAVFDPSGRPVYLGPYADIARCSTARGGPVEAAVAKSARETELAGPRPAAMMGCFCNRSQQAALHTALATETGGMSR